MKKQSLWATICVSNPNQFEYVYPMSAEKKPSRKSAKKRTTKLPWYSEGLSFECTQCGLCCSGEPGYVWVDDSEIAAMAKQMQMELDDFESKFIRKVGADKSLREYPDGDCILLDPEKRTCLVYQARPIQCRTWPFWDSNLSSKKDWKETCEACPGAGKGKLYTFEQIEVQRKEKSV
ncbi:YkgJ family cysteine cluster protein [Stieleria sp. JC731]|uniref:YkgJ family cysteine cluster protein n=1 Tax=Stieleria sp. JC731 TaxID=2894195 RepID=UPI001E3664F2|nr:YkgJ family cysteine cluster protein [Stieleria sp. JC731]